jgi:hypothetical protein
MSELEKLEKALEDQEKACEEARDAWDAAEAARSVFVRIVAIYRKEHGDAKEV